jgi:DNA topoisomerase-1
MCVAAKREMAKSKSVLVIVESPTKAKTIKKFLGKGYQVHSCMGHIRDLPQSAKDIPEKLKKQKWTKLGVNVEEDFEPLYCIPKNKEKVVSQLKDKLADADELLLATDEDREGESISWHLLEVLKPKVPFKRMVFGEITKEAIEEALSNTRKIDDNLVRAQEARRILDRLVGYTLSPLIWKKVAFGLSAGRVQSVAVKLICDREGERMRFKKSQYWSIQAEAAKSNQSFEAHLHEWKDLRIATGKDFDSTTGDLLPEAKKKVALLDEKKAKEIAEKLKKATWKVSSVEERPVSRKPAPPFITSTLQQEANRKLGWASNTTMRTAQALYEQGFITYMRTDSTMLSSQALKAARECIVDLYGKEYLSPEPRQYAGKKVKGAQEAHEAIRPAGTAFVTPEQSGLGGDQAKLYDLIWKRTVASQMAESQQKQVSVRIAADEGVIAASGTSIVFPGFLRAYVEGSDDPEAALEERDTLLPAMKVGDKVDCKKLTPQDHETKPPARYTEASLIQTMEKEGIGRPSTYAATISTVVNRGYVQKIANALAPTFTAMVVNRLLGKYFPQYVDIQFTSKMEESLDEIAAGDLDSIKYLKSVYLGKDGLKKLVETQDKIIKPEEARAIEIESLKGLSVRVGRFGAYVCRSKGKKGEEVCASLPDSQPPADVTLEIANQLIDQKEKGVDALGKDPTTGEKIFVLNGRFGPYVQRGEGDEGVKRASLPAGVKPEEVTIEKALDLLSLPKTVGLHPETKKEVKVGFGRFGPYVVHNGEFRSIPKTEDLFSVDLKRALEIMSRPKVGRGRATPIKELGKHPADGELVSVFDGKYGPYIKWGKLNASVPDGVKAEEMTMEKAVVVLEEKAAQGGGSKKGKFKNAKSAKTAKPSPMTKNVISGAGAKKKAKQLAVAKKIGKSKETTKVTRAR